MNNTKGEWNHLSFYSCNGFGLYYLNGKYKFHLNLGQNLLPKNTLTNAVIENKS